MSRAKADEEDYWNSSTITRPFTFDDEDDEYTQVRQVLI